MNISSLAKAAGAMASDLKAKAKDAVSEAQHVQQRVTQQALEAAGMADKTDDDDSLPELR